MKRVLDRRPSASMVVALTALVVAMSGSAVAATSLVNGDRLIRKGTLSGNRLRKHTLTGRQINLKRLGKVPTAGYSDLSGHANTSVYAVKAQSANDADTVGGQPASSFLTTGSRIGTSGVVKVNGSTSGTTVTLFSHGPFTVQMTCTTSGSDTSMYVSASSGEANSDVDGVLNPTAGSFVKVGPSISATASPTSADDYVLAFEAPSGAQAVVSGSFGVNSLNATTQTGDCWANLSGIA